jgi:hypothetical protein
VVEPGVMSSQYFYIAGSPGLQMYSYKKDFPELARGDKSENYGRARGNIWVKCDVKIADCRRHSSGGKKRVRIYRMLLVVADIDEPYEGWLTESVKGRVTGIKGSYVYLDDGTDEVRLYIRGGSGIDKSAIC